MSRSRKKHCKLQYACGNDGPWFKDRRKNTRIKNKHMLRNLLSKYDITDVADLIISIQNKQNKNFDDWNKPSDGTYLCFDKNSKWYIKGLRK